MIDSSCASSWLARWFSTQAYFRPCRRRLLLKLASALAALDSKLAAALAAQHSSQAAAALVRQFNSALAVLRECCLLGQTAQLLPEQMAQLAECGSLIVGDTSRAVLANWLKQSAALLPSPGGEPAGAQPPSHDSYAASTVPGQLAAASVLLSLLMDSGGSRLELLATSAWPPERVTRWLASVLVVVDTRKRAGARALGRYSNEVARWQFMCMATGLGCRFCGPVGSVMHAWCSLDTCSNRSHSIALALAWRQQK